MDRALTEAVMQMYLLASQRRVMIARITLKIEVS
jgi:hypothetical protein